MTEYLSTHKDATMLTEAIAQLWLVAQKKSIKEKKKFYVALSGGSTPKSLYRLLASDKYSSQIDWSQVVIFFGDERCVPHDHADSNYLMAKQTLLDYVDIPAEQIHIVPYLPEQYAEVASQYQQVIETSGITMQNNFPQFDLMLLGMGDDGHTASLFPGTDILNEQEKWVAEVYVEKFDSWRVSMTYPVINNSAKICIMVAGEAKATVINEILADNNANVNYPISKIQAKGDIHWMLDTAATKELTNSKIHPRLTKVA